MTAGNTVAHEGKGMSNPDRVPRKLPDPVREALRQSEEQFERLVAGVEDYSIVILSPEGLVSSWNEGARRQTGWDASEIVGEPYTLFFTPQDIAANVPAIQLDIVRHEGRLSNEQWRVRKDGSRYWAAVNATPLASRPGQTAGFLLITRDLSERKSAEHRIRESERHFRLLVEGVREYAIFMLDPTGHIQSWNPGAERIKGYREDEVIGKHFSIFYTAEALADNHPARELTQALEQGMVEDEGWRLRKDGSRFWANVVITALRDAEGRHLGFAKVTRDMTDRRLRAQHLERQNRMRLQESEERFARFAEHLPGLAWIKDLQGRYIYVNHSAARAFGAAATAIVGRSDDELFPPDTAEAFREHDRQALEAGTGIQVIEFLRDPQGSTRHSIVSKFPIRGDDGAAHLLGGIAIDITERVQAEESLRRADRRKDEFLATLSHELRNPLAPIQNGLALLQRIGPGADADRVHSMMQHQLDQLVRLVDDLLEVSRISGGKISLRKQTVVLAEVIQGAIDTSMPRIEAGKHRLTVTLPEEPIMLEADPIRLGQILSNLLDNAAKYTNDGGNIWVTATRLEEAAVITIKDDGLGIPAELIPRVFDMFAQIDRMLKRSQGGLGIGLSLAQTLVDLHGGRLEARSEGPDKGSEFVVRLPLTERRSESRRVSPARLDALEMPPTPRRILVVDDSRDGGESLAMVLKMMGADAEVVYDGPSALEAVRSWRPDTVLLDIGMPEMDGYEVAARIRSDPELRSLRLIALTGWGSEESRRRSRESGFDEHWVKPVDPARLRVLVSTGAD